MHIIKLEAENFKRLKAVEITPKGNVVQITGRNGNGKTSVLDAIWAALGGGSSVPPEPIRKGEKRARVTVDLGDLIVERRFTEAGSTLVVTGKDGAKISSPQRALDELVGRLTFDPLQFMRLEPKKQAETLRLMVGLDFTALDAERKQVFEARTVVNRKVGDLEARGKAVVVPPDAPDAEISVADASDALQAALAAVTERERHVALIERQRRDADSCLAQIAEYERQIAALQANIGSLRNSYDGIMVDLKANEQSLGSLCPPDVDGAKARLADLDRLNAGARAKLQRRDLAQQYRQAKAEADALTDQLDGIDRQKAEALAAAKFPVPGLSFGEEGVTFNDLPLPQASGAEQLRVSVAMAMALNPKLRVLRIADGSLLDSTSLALLSELAKEHDYQLWIEAVDESGQVGVVIEDGEVAADHQDAAA